MENIFWIIVVIVLAGAVIWYLKGKKRELPTQPEEPEEPTPPSETPTA